MHAVVSFRAPRVVARAVLTHWIGCHFVNGREAAPVSDRSGLVVSAWRRECTYALLQGWLPHPFGQLDTDSLPIPIYSCQRYQLTISVSRPRLRLPSFRSILHRYSRYRVVYRYSTVVAVAARVVPRTLSPLSSRALAHRSVFLPALNVRHPLVPRVCTQEGSRPR